MARKGNPISVRLDLNRSSDSSWFSDSYYGKLVYQDINLRSYFGSIRPPTILTFGFRLGRCIIIHFQKRTFINFFLPCRPQPQRQRRERRKKLRSMKMKDRWWGFGKVGPIECLYSSEGRKEERNEVRGRRAGKRVESIKKQRYPSIKKNLSKSLRVRGGSKHPKYAALNYSVMQYLLNTKNKMNSDPVLVLNHFVAPGVVEPSTMKRANAQGRSLDKRIRSRIAFFVESSTSEKKCLAEAKKRLTHFIHQANDLRFAGRRKTTIPGSVPLSCASTPRYLSLSTLSFPYSKGISSALTPPHLTTCLFPSLGAAFSFYGVYNHIFCYLFRIKLLGQLRRKCWNLMGKDKVMKLIDKFIDLGGIRELIKGIEMMIEIILKNRRFPYRYNSYLNQVKKMQSLLSNRTNTNTVIESVKVQSVYQSASPIAQDISFQPKKKRGSFRSIFSKIVPSVMKKGVEGIRICCSGRLEGAEIARTECGKYGKTSCNVLHRKIDYASAEVSTRYGIIGVKVWISYSPKEKGRAIPETYSSRGCKPDGTQLGLPVCPRDKD